MSNVILFNGIAALLIVLIIVWFWLIKSKSTQVQVDEITVYVKDGAYSPNRIETSHSKLTINFIREDVSPCSEYVLFEQLNVHEQLPLKKPHKIILTNLKSGHYRFTCQMGMYQGELIVTRQ